MVHIQARGRRISALTQNMKVGSSLELEVWGPYRPDGKPFQIISFHPAAVTISRGVYNSSRNSQTYKVNAVALTARTRIEVVNTDLLDEAKGLDITNINTPFQTCDTCFIAVEPTSNAPTFSDYFGEVIPAIAHGLAKYAASRSPGLKDKAGFLLVQTYGEQSPVVTTKPSLHNNRMFNVQAQVDIDKHQHMNIRPGQQEPGVSIPWLSQGEGPSNAQRVLKSSPTFGYESPEQAVLHYLKILEQRYVEAFKIISDENGKFSAFTVALKRAGYATDAKYAETLQGLSSRALSQGKAWVDFQIKTLDHDVATEENEGEKGRLAKEREALLKFKAELDNFRP